MKGRYPLRPFLVPGLLGLATAAGLLGALFSNHWLETLAVAILALVVGGILHLLCAPFRRRPTAASIRDTK